MARDNRVRVSDEEIRLVRKAKEVWYGDDVAEDIPDGKAIGTFADFVIKDQGSPGDLEEARVEHD